MKLKTIKAQRDKLYNCGIGSGFIVWKSATCELMEVEFYIARNGELRRVKDGNLLLPLEVRHEEDE